MCADLACSPCLRGRRQPALRVRRDEEALTVEERTARALGSLGGFLAEVRGTAG
ncbi:FBP domain-containing protein [Streptomyces sp. CAU 1734]|uniref:FBP domain-containing protein n=1 Tax=Streptomyces sp. CAU 1734 TaxID=3140360 RepID=UPI003261A30C